MIELAGGGGEVECSTLLTYSELGFWGIFPGSYLRGIATGCIVVQTGVSLSGD